MNNNSFAIGRYLIFRRHPIFLFYATIRFLFFLLACAVFAMFVWMYREDIPTPIRYLAMFPIIFFLANYAFFRLILAIVNYENKLIILADDKLIIVNCTLILQDDVEVMNLYRIMKIDVECHGLLPMIFGYGTLLVEQQTTDIRSFHFIPHPYETLKILNDHLLGLEDHRRNLKRMVINEVADEKFAVKKDTEKKEN